jgi:Flp pilus assembly pilin Flp
MSHRTIDLVGLLREGLGDESGQDVIEYALLGAMVGIASALAWSLLVTTVGSVYSAADADVQNVSACTPDPGGGGCP